MTQTEPDAKQAARAWWRQMWDEPHGRRPQRAALANLRRAHSPVNLLLEPQTLELLRMVRAARPTVNEDRVAVLAGILAYIRHDDPQLPVARAVGCTSFGDPGTAALSEARFRRLLQCQEHELLHHFRRLAMFMKGRANVRNLAWSVLFWGDAVKKRWIFDYFSAGSDFAPPTAAPDAAAPAADL